MAVNLSALAGAGQQFFDNSGNPLTGGKLYSYAAGTTTPQATYTSASGSTAHSNPIILDSAGRVATGEIWLTAGSNYKFVLKTSADVSLATWDNITGINGTGITSNAVNVTYDPAGTQAVATTVQAKLRETVSVMDFGAVGDGVANDTVAIQAALDYCKLNSNSLYFPAGTYLCSGVTYSQTSSADAVPDLFGEGARKTVIKKYGTSTDSVLSFTSTSSLFGLYQRLENFTVEGNNGASVHSGIEFNTWAYLLASNVEVYRCTTGIDGNGLLTSVWEKCDIHNNTIVGYAFNKLNTTYANAIKIIGGTISFNARYGLALDFGSGLRLYGVNIEGNGTVGDLASGGVSIGGNVSAEFGFSQFTFHGCWFESNNGVGIYFAPKVSGDFDPQITIEDSTIISTDVISGSANAVKIESSRQTSILGSLLIGSLATLTVTARYLRVINSTISFIVNASTDTFYSGLTTNAGELSTPNITFPLIPNLSSDPLTFDDYREESYTATATGMTTAPTGIIVFTRVGNTITMKIPIFTGTSNATTFTLTGGPTTMRPAASSVVPMRVSDNGGAIVFGLAIIGTDGTISLASSPAVGAFTASGIKATAAFQFSYQLKA